MSSIQRTGHAERQAKQPGLEPESDPERPKRKKAEMSHYSTTVSSGLLDPLLQQVFNRIGDKAANGLERELGFPALTTWDLDQ